MKNYTVRIVTENFETHDEDGYSKKAAIIEAKRLVTKYKTENKATQVFVLTGGNGGMGCYLNRDGNHAITGKAW